MTPQQIEAMKMALEALEWANKEINGWRDDAYGYDAEDQPTIMSAVNAIKEALAEHAMQEAQKLGQEIEQEPVELCQYGQEPASCTSNPMDCQCAIDASLAQTKEPDDIASILACRDMLDAQPVPPRTTG